MIRVDPNPITGVLIKRRKLETETERMPGESKGRDWSNPSPSKDHQRLQTNHQESEESMEKMLFYNNQKEQTLPRPYSRTSSLYNYENQFLLFKPILSVVLRWGSCSKLI